jgi:hypothetical protein
MDAAPVFPGHAYEARLEPNLIPMDDDKLIANIFYLEPLPAGMVVLYTTTSQAYSRLCHLTAVSVSLSFTTMS